MRMYKILRKEKLNDVVELMEIHAPNVSRKCEPGDVYKRQIFIFTPKLPLSIVVMVFALYVSIMGISHFVTYCYYRKEKVNGRLLFLLSAIVLIVVGISFILSPSVHAKEMTYIFILYTLYLGIKYMLSSMKELLSENRKNSLKRRIRVSLPIFMVAFMPRVMIEYINEKLEVEDEIMKQEDDLSLSLIHI